jgi:hypothetical protein
MLVVKQVPLNILTIGSRGKMTNKILIVLGIFIMGAFSGHTITDNTWQNKWDKAEKIAAEKQLNLVNDAVKTYNRKLKQTEELKDETENKLNVLSSVNDSLDDANKRLQEQYELKLRERPTCDQSPTIIRNVKTENFDKKLYSDMFRVVSNRAAHYAKIADENRIRGLSCEAEYEILVRSFDANF